MDGLYNVGAGGAASSVCSRARCAAWVGQKEGRWPYGDENANGLIHGEAPLTGDKEATGCRLIQGALEGRLAAKKVAKRGDLRTEIRRWMPALLFYALNRNQIVFRVLLADLPGCLVFW